MNAMSLEKQKYRRINLVLLVLIFLSVAICVESYRLGMGTFNKPGSGLFPFITGLLIGVLSTVRQFSPGEQNRIPNVSAPLNRMLLMAAALFVYAFLLDKIGFILSTILLIVFFLRVIEAKSWIVTALIAIPTPFCTYLVFKVLLRVQMPIGFIGF